VSDASDLDDLERELGPTLRLALRRFAAEALGDGSTGPPVSTSTEEDLNVIDFKSSTSPTATGDRRRPWIIATALAAAAVIVVAVVAVLATRDDVKPADEQATEIAESFMTAWVRGDGAAVAALLSSSGSFDQWTKATLPNLGAWYQAMGWQYKDGGCVAASPGQVSCDYTAENDLTRAFGRGPQPGSLVLDIAGGRVTNVGDDFNSGANLDIWTAFNNWVTANHRGDVDLMYTASAESARVDPISIQLWATLTGEYVESGDAYVSRARAICVVAHDEYDGLVAGGTPTDTAKLESAARVLDEALTQMRSLQPPENVQSRFATASSVIQQIVDGMRQLSDAGSNARDLPAASELQNLINALPHTELGLERCAINPLR